MYSLICENIEKMNDVYLSLGSNEGNRMLQLQNAIRAISNLNLKIEKVSSVFETPAMGFDGNAFYNLCLHLTTQLLPIDLLKSFKKIENDSGRVQRKKGEPYRNRPIDIDILFYGSTVLETPTLTLPHPLLDQRIFVLAPLEEIATEFVHPLRKMNVSELLKSNNKSQPISKIGDFTHL